MMRKTTAVAVVIVGFGVATFAALPPARSVLNEQGFTPPVRGAFHVHTSRSDGSGTVEQVAAAAARAGLDFVVLTDHGDATRLPTSPAYHSGVLCIDAVEISTSGGHLVALGLSDRSPYPLGGEPRDAVEDVHRQGGMAIAAHPDSRKNELRWTDSDTPLDGLEWLNADSEWRDEGPFALAKALLTYPWRRAETLAAMLNRPEAVLKRWNTLAASRRVVALAGADAHANLGLGTSHPYGDRSWLAVPAYEQSFRTFSIALPGLTLTKRADTDGAAVVDAIRSGHVYSTLDALAGAGLFEMSATSGSATAAPGDELALGGPIRFSIRSNAPPDATVVLYKDGVELTRGTAATLDFTAPAAAGTYRAEVMLSRHGEVPWIVANPVYVGLTPPITAPTTPLQDVQVQYEDGPIGQGWGIEKSDQALGELDAVPTLTGMRARLRYGLAGSTVGDAWVALGMLSGTGLERFDRVIFKAQADKPMRLWFQLWMPIPTGNAYWRRSIYLDETEREIVVPIADLLPTPGSPRQPPLAEIKSLMFAVDQTHTPLGRSGTFWIDSIRYAR